MPLVLTPVKSSNIEAVGHHGGNLHVRFKGGAEYVYEGVPAEMHKEMIEAESIGGHFRAKIMKNFSGRKVDA